MADTGAIDLSEGVGSEFVAEIRDDLELLEPDLLAMEDEQSNVDAELINRAFRSIHSIKGGAGFCGFKDLGMLSHSMENVLMRIRDGRLHIASEIVDALLSGLDKLKLMIEALDTGDPVSFEDEIRAFERILEQKENIDQPDKDQPVKDQPDKNQPCKNQSDKDQPDNEPMGKPHGEPGGPSHDVEMSSDKGMAVLITPEDSFFRSRSFQVKKDDVKAALSEGKFIYAVHFDLERDFIKPKKGPADIYIDVENTGDILFFDLERNTTLEQLKDHSLGVHLVVATILDSEFLSEVLELPGDEICLFDASALSLAASESSFDSVSEASAAPSKSPSDLLSAPDSSLDTLSDLASETVSKGSSGGAISDSQTSDPGSLDPPRGQDNEGVDRGETDFPQQKADQPGIVQKKTGVEVKKTVETIRVNVDLITRLMNFAGELVLSRNQLRPLIEAYARENADLNSVMQDLDMVTSEIQEDIMQIRMQPVGKLLSRFKRIIRDTARQLSKKISYTIEGEGVELDRTVLEGLSNPMTHLMRNAVDHGIETPEQRSGNNKPETGIISVKAFHEGGNVHINISDDGMGIDPEKICSKAVEKGVISKRFAEKMTHKEKIDLIFSPGFSTSETITDVSGRGVGMDVVRTNIEKLRGHIDMDSIPGQGTTVQMIIPLTLAIVSALIVGVDRFRFAIPQVNVSEVVFLSAADLKKNLEKVGGSDVIRLRERLLPVIRLRNLLDIDSFYIDEKTGQKEFDRRKTLVDRRDSSSDSFSRDYPEEKQEKQEKQEKEEKRSNINDRRQTDEGGMYIVVVKVGFNRFGLCVESLFDNEEIVVKPLSDHMKSCRCFSGATILGDGNVIMILDASGMANHANLRFAVVNSEDQRRKIQEAQRGRKLLEGRNVIVFSNAENEFFAIPLSRMVRLEKITPDLVHRVGSLKYMAYQDISISIFNLEDFIPVNPCRSDLEALYVIIPRGMSVKSGIIVSNIIETMEVFQIIKKDSNTPPGVEGTAFVDNRLVQFLDMEKIVKMMEDRIVS
ncbi:MAG: chemotaxis protein CheA [Thermodesulfobacteriota bacterium]|nr:chemotaxis protein CheA [Thermodesulfobacteriota bacterium]